MAPASALEKKNLDFLACPVGVRFRIPVFETGQASALPIDGGLPLCGYQRNVAFTTVILSEASPSFTTVILSEGARPSRRTPAFAHTADAAPGSSTTTVIWGAAMPSHPGGVLRSSFRTADEAGSPRSCSH